MLARRAIRVLRYLPAKLSAPDIAGMPCLPVNTTKTGMRHLYDKPGAHRRHEAVDQVGALGPLAPPPLKVLASAPPPAAGDSAPVPWRRTRPPPRAGWPGASHPAV